jgi:hypothetical protein
MDSIRLTVSTFTSAPNSSRVKIVSSRLPPHLSLVEQYIGVISFCKCSEGAVLLYMAAAYWSLRVRKHEYLRHSPAENEPSRPCEHQQQGAARSYHCGHHLSSTINSSYSRTTTRFRAGQVLLGRQLPYLGAERSH